MSIISGPFLFCEGKPDSFDALMLVKLEPSKAAIVPSGGKYGINNFVQGRLSVYSKTPEYLVFRDRDFDAEPPDTPCLIAPKQDKQA